MSLIEQIRYDLVFQYHSLAQFITDAQGKIIHVNERLQNITRYTLEELSGKSIDSLFSKQDKKRLFLFHNKKNVSGSVSFTHEIQIVTKDGEKKEVKIWFNIHQDEIQRVHQADAV